MITPSNFRADPLGWAGNQAGHLLIGAAVAFAAAMSGLWLMGEYPSRWVIAAVVAVVYLAIELPQCGGLADTLEDIMFCCGYGVAIFVFTFREVEPGNSLLVFNPQAATAPLAVLAVHFAAGTLIRYAQLKGRI